jgi:alpha-galactosidase
MSQITRLVGGLIAALVAILWIAPTVAALDDGLAHTPPMGWNSWNKFGCDVSEDLIKQTADAMASSGMKEAGYEYIVIDDCWQASRDASGNIMPDSTRFPSGMKALADYVHSKGLKFGLYSDAGTKTCQGRPGGKNHEEQDASRYAAWGVDYLKYDWCHTDGLSAEITYPIMSQALQKSGRPIVFSICEWGGSKPWQWAQDVGHLWRTSEDINNCWACSHMGGGAGFTKILDQQAGLESFAGPGHWNDPDMLEVGNGVLTDSEARAHFSLWCALAAPLIAGNDLRDMSPETLAILTNREVIAVDQDPLGVQASKIRRENETEAWWKKLSDGGRAVVFFNRGQESRGISVSWKEIGLSAGPASVRDLWLKKDLGAFTDGFAADVDGHSAVMVRITP